MNAKMLTSTLSFLAFALGALAAPGCAVESEKRAPEGAESSSEALAIGGGGGGATNPCAKTVDEGYCQCFGEDECAYLSLYCTHEPVCYGQGTPSYHCICLTDAVAPPRPTPTPINPPVKLAH
jgi:hypothetical protein